MASNVVTAADILSSDGRHPDRAKVAPAGVVAAAADLATRLTALLTKYGSRPIINSGYRTPEANKAAGGAPNSSHLYGMAVDFSDSKHVFYDWCTANIQELTANGLWREDGSATSTWQHLQSRPVPGAVQRTFKP